MQSRSLLAQCLPLLLGLQLKKINTIKCETFDQRFCQICTIIYMLVMNHAYSNRICNQMY